MTKQPLFYPAILRIAQRTALFAVGYLAATVFSAAVVTVTTRGTFYRFSEVLPFITIAIGAFSLLPALLALVLIKRRKLPPLKCLVLSAGMTGLLGAPIAVWMLWYRAFRQSIGYAMTFTAISTLSGLISGLIFWFFLFRLFRTERSPPSRS